MMTMPAPTRLNARSQAGLNAPHRVFPENLTEFRKHAGLSYREFGILLWQAEAGDRKQPYSKPYVIALEKGQRPLTPAVEIAFLRLAAAQDDTDPLALTVTAQTVYAVHDIGGAVVLGKVKPCARPGCPVKFVGTPTQKYHSAHCREMWAKEKRRVHHD